MAQQDPSLVFINGWIGDGICNAVLSRSEPSTVLLLQLDDCNFEVKPPL